MGSESKRDQAENSVFQDLSAFSLPEKFRGRSAVLVQLWWIVQGTIFAWTPDIMYPFRSWLLRIFGAKIGHGVRFRPSARVTYPWNLSVGDDSWIGHDTVMYNLAKISIGRDVALAHGVYLCTGLHDVTDVAFRIDAKPITIEDECWLANDCFIAPGVTLGRGVVIGARSTVLGDMPAGMICYGYPCRAVRPRRECK